MQKAVEMQTNKIKETNKIKTDELEKAIGNFITQHKDAFATDWMVTTSLENMLSSILGANAWISAMLHEDGLLHIVTTDGTFSLKDLFLLEQWFCVPDDCILITASNEEDLKEAKAHGFDNALSIDIELSQRSLVKNNTKIENTRL